MSDRINSTIAFKEGFLEVKNKILQNGCHKNCYNVFERYLQNIGVPQEMIDDIYTGSGFDNWNHLYKKRLESKHSVPVRTSMNKIVGISNAVEKMLDMHIEALGSESISS